MLPLQMLIALGGVGFIRALPWFGTEDPVHGAFHHAHLTWHGAAAAGWKTHGDNPDVDKSSPAAALAWHTDYVDSYLYNPVWWAAGGWARFQAALLARDELTKVHFDDLVTIHQIRTMWRRYQAGTVAGLQFAAWRGDVAAARHIVGIGLHAIQDFYAHSNWVDEPSRRTVDPAQATSDVVAKGPAARLWPGPDPEAAGLYTGMYEHTSPGFKQHGKIRLDCTLMRNLVGENVMDFFCHGLSPMRNSSTCRAWAECDDALSVRPQVFDVRLPGNFVLNEEGIALDSLWQAPVAHHARDLPDREAISPEGLFAAAYRCALQHTTQWLEDLATIMGREGYKAFWTDVKSLPRTGYRDFKLGAAFGNFVGAYVDDLHQYESKDRLLYTFLSTGQYPPRRDAVEDEGWYLRLEIATADALWAGTDSHIVAGVNGERFRLDHMHNRTVQGGLDELRLLEHDDFQRGERVTYCIGPVAHLPRTLELRNETPDSLDVINGLFKDLGRAAKAAWDALVELVLSLTGGHADFIGTATRTWSWAELVAIMNGGGQQRFVLAFDHKDEGKYHIQSSLTVTQDEHGLHVRVDLERLDCHRESTWDQSTSDDEPFVLVSIDSFADDKGRTGDIVGPYGGVDSGDNRHMGKSYNVDVPRYGGLAVSTQMWESDLELAKGRKNLLDRFTSDYGSNTVNERSAFLDALAGQWGADWEPAEIDVFAFRRGTPVVETAYLARNLPVTGVVAANTLRTIALEAVEPIRTDMTIVRKAGELGRMTEQLERVSDATKIARTRATEDIKDPVIIKPLRLPPFKPPE